MTSTTTIIHLTTKNAQSPSPANYTIKSTFGHESPRFTIKGRGSLKVDVNKVGYDYSPNTIGTGLKKSLSSRPRDRNIDPTPGPSYMPPPFGSSSPRISFHGKIPVKMALGTDSPGPGKYDTMTKSTSPRYSISHRTFEDVQPDGPGPGKYSPDYEKVMPNAPGTHIRPKVQEPKKMITPGPYDIPHQLDTRSSVFHRRAKELAKDNFPGPGKYDTATNFGSDGPRYSIRPRYHLTDKITAAPYQKLQDVTGNDAPKYSISTKARPRDVEVTPGPNYQPPPFASGSIRLSIAKRYKENEIIQGPGPGKYNTRDDALSGPKFTIKSRKYPNDEGSIDGPGPGKYAPDYDKVLSSAPKTSIRIKAAERTIQETPGFIGAPPVDTGPKYTIGRKDGHEIAPGISF